ncbi:glycoside hydrolase domain-containing protein [Facklamia sp. 252]|uniref:glycoside hydrolase domain-containing protein n=1 Tax=Aerococcaceae TaxID=186827 RepID=UPI0013D4CDAD|nr:glycoside hydrolase domain-containing protein [Facklamia sp. 252]
MKYKSRAFRCMETRCRYKILKLSTGVVSALVGFGVMNQTTAVNAEELTPPIIAAEESDAQPTPVNENNNPVDEENGVEVINTNTSEMDATVNNGEENNLGDTAASGNESVNPNGESDNATNEPTESTHEETEVESEKEEVAHSTFVDNNLHYTNDEVDEVLAANNHEQSISAWKNDEVNTQIAVVAKEGNLTNVRVELSDLVNKKTGSIISKEHLSSNFINELSGFRYNAGYHSSDKLTIRTEPSIHRPDLLSNAETVNIEEGKLKNIWLNAKIPENVESGEYVTTVKVLSDELEQPLEFQVNVTVQDVTLQNKSKFDIELWQYPYRSAEYYGVEPFSEKHLAILRPHLEKYKAIGGNGITTSIVEEAWGGQTYAEGNVRVPSMIKWFKEADGTFTYDFTDFDKWVSFNQELGLGDKIVGYSMIPWGNRITYTNRATGNVEYVTIPVTDSRYAQYWTPFLKKLVAHLDEKEWFDSFYVGIDERPNMDRAFDVIDSVKNKNGKSLKKAAAANHFSGAFKSTANRVDHLSIGTPHMRGQTEAFKQFVEERKAKGLKTTLYTATEEYPNSLLFSLPGESYFSVMYGAKFNTDGFLRWAYDAWVKDPLNDLSHWAFESGDTQLIYPDDKNAVTPRSQASVRLEKMAEAVRDINKLYQIRDEVPSLAKDVQALLDTLKDDYESKVTASRAGGRQISREPNAEMRQLIGTDLSTFKRALSELTDKYIDYKANATNEVTDIEIGHEEIELVVGESAQIDALIQGKVIDNRINYETTNRFLATVDSSGRIQATGNGVTKIIVSSKANPEIKKEVIVRVQPVDILKELGEHIVTHLKFEDNLNDEKNGLTLNGTEFEYVEGIDGKAVRIPKASSLQTQGLDLTNNYSLAFWMKQVPTNNGNEVRSIFWNGKALAGAKNSTSIDSTIGQGDASPNMGWHVPEGYLTFKYKNVLEGWNHYAFTKSQQGIVLYVNGEEIGNIAWGRDVKIPFEHIGGRNFEGELDEILVVDRVLTNQEIKQLSFVPGINAQSELMVNIDKPDALPIQVIGTISPLTYEIEHPEILSIDENGVATGLKFGTTNVTVSTADGKFTKNIQVTVDKIHALRNQLPQFDIPKEKTFVMDRKHAEYLGQPDMVKLNDDKTLITVYPKGHGHGEIVMRISEDGGKTWSDRILPDESWKGSKETPTLYTLDFTDGRQEVMMIYGGPKAAGWGDGTGGFTTSISKDKGKTWSGLQEFYKDQAVLVGLASLIQVYENGKPIDKWMGVFHDWNYVNYKTYLTFDSEGHQQWSAPEPYLNAHRQVELENQICEVSLIRSPDKTKIAALGRTQAHKGLSMISFSEDEGNTWTKPRFMPASLLGERHKYTYDPVSGRLFITFREIIQDFNNNGRLENNDWMAGDWIGWVGTFEDLEKGNDGEYRVRLGEDFTPNAKSGDTGYAGVVALNDGTIVTDSYGVFYPEDARTRPTNVQPSITWTASILGARFTLEDLDRVAYPERFKNENESPSVTDENLEHPSADLSTAGANISEMFNTDHDNTWVFTGGLNVQGGSAFTEGIRNYVGQFEEYIRWTKSGNTNAGLQRYVINTAKAGTTINTIAENFDTYVGRFAPKAAAYMLGLEDCEAGNDGIEAFKTSLKSFIDSSLALNNNHGKVVLQTSSATADNAVNAKIEAYIDAMKQVAQTYAGTDAWNNIVFVDHYAQTNKTEFLEHGLVYDVALNAKGHLEIGKQLAAATIKTTDKFPGTDVRLNLENESKVQYFATEEPTATYSTAGLAVVIPEVKLSKEGPTLTNWHYEVAVGNKVIAGNETSNNFTITGLPDNQAYTLTLRSADGTVQLRTVVGQTVEANESSLKDQTLSEKQERIRQLVEDKQPLTWLFMGDSITHGALWTKGYDGITQLFEKYLYTTLGRKGDTVINTAVSGATVQDTLTEIAHRLNHYNPDVISIMLGTNDAGTVTAEEYKAQLTNLVNLAKAKNVPIILRTPTPTTLASHGPKIPRFVEKMKEVAAENPEIILIDQYTPFNDLLTSYPYLWKPAYSIITDNFPLHPGANGHVLMAREFIKGLGIWTDDSPITNLYYKMPIEKQDSDVVPSVTAENGAISLSIDTLKQDLTSPFKKVTMTAIDKESGKTFTVTGDTGTLSLDSLDKGKNYDVSVSVQRTDRPIINVLKTSSYRIEEEVETPTQPSDEVETPTQPSEEVETPAQPSEEVETPTQPSEEVEKPVQPSEEVETPTQPSEEVETPTQPSEGVETPTQPSEEVETPTQPSEGVETPTQPSEGVEAPTQPSEEVETPTQPSEGVETPTQPSEEVEIPTPPSEEVETPTQPSEGVETPTQPSEGVEPPTQPSEGVETPTQPSEEVEAPTQPSEEVEPPTQPSEGVETPTQPSEGVEPPTQPSEEVEIPTPPSEEVEPPTQPSEGVETPTQPSEGVEPPTQPSEEVEIPTPPSEEVEPPTQPSEGVETPTQPSEGVEPPTQPSEEVEIPTPPSEEVETPTQPSEGVETPTQPSEGVEAPTQPSEGVEAPTQPSEGVEPPTPPSEEVETPTQPSEEVEKPTQPSEEVEPPTQPSEGVETPTQPSGEVEAPIINKDLLNSDKLDGFNKADKDEDTTSVKPSEEDGTPIINEDLLNSDKLEEFNKTDKGEDTTSVKPSEEDGTPIINKDLLNSDKLEGFNKTDKGEDTTSVKPSEGVEAPIINKDLLNSDKLEGFNKPDKGEDETLVKPSEEDGTPIINKDLLNSDKLDKFNKTDKGEDTTLVKPGEEETPIINKDLLNKDKLDKLVNHMESGESQTNKTELHVDAATNISVELTGEDVGRGLHLVVGRLQNNPLGNSLDEHLKGKEFDLYDIHFENAQGEVTQIKSEAVVTLPRDVAKEVSGVYYVATTGMAESLPYDLLDNAVRFKVTHFSYYAVVYGAQTEQNGTQSGTTTTGTASSTSATNTGTASSTSATNTVTTGSTSATNTVTTGSISTSNIENSDTSNTMNADSTGSSNVMNTGDPSSTNVIKPNNTDSSNTMSTENSTMKPEMPNSSSAMNTEKSEDNKVNTSREEQQPSMTTSTMNKMEMSSERLPETGENDAYLIFSAAALSIIAGVGLVSTRRKEN